MKKLIICGKANMEKDVSDIRTKNSELWMLGTDPRIGADRYFELHGLPVEHENVTYELPDKVYELGLPVSNSICALALFAFISGYKDISIVGAPMDSKTEYIKERSSLALVVGFLTGSGLKVNWDGMPDLAFYGKRTKPEDNENIEE